MIGLRKIDSGALAEKVRYMGRPARGAKPLAEAAERKAAEVKGAKAGARFGGRRLREGLKVVSGFDSYSPWSGAEDTYRRIADAGKLGELEDWLEEMYPDGIGETELNDLLWFDADEVLSAMGISDEDDEDEDEDSGRSESMESPKGDGIRYKIEYWEDEEAREEGLGEFLLDEFGDIETAKATARKMVDRDGMASVEVLADDGNGPAKTIWGYDGIETWAESLASVGSTPTAPRPAEPMADKAMESVSEGISEGVAEMDFAVSGNGFEPSSEDDDVGSFAGF